MSNSVYINATSTFMPNAPVDNLKIEDVLGLYDGRASRAKNVILASNGIETRHYALDPVTRLPTHNNAQLTAAALKNLFAENEAYSWSDVDLMVCGTSSPDLLLPAHGQMVHGELPEFNGEVVTTAGVCCSAMAALKYAYLSVKSGESQGAVVTGSEASSKFMRSEFFESEKEEKLEELKKNPAIQFEHDFLRWMLSDGAGAMLVTDKAQDGQLNFKINWMEGRSYAGEQPVCMHAGGFRESSGEVVPWKDLRLQGDEKKLNHAMNVHQDIRQLREYAAKLTVERALADIKKKRGLRPGDYTWFLPHYSSHYFRAVLQNSMQAIDFVIPEDRWFTSLYEKGNVGSASIFVFLHELQKQKELNRGEKILCYIPESARFSCYYLELEVV